MNQTRLLFSMMERHGKRKIDMAHALGWDSEKLIRWSQTSQRPYQPWIDEIDLCWQHLGYLLVPVKIPGMSILMSTGNNVPRANRRPYNCHRIVRSLFEELDIRRISREDFGNLVGIHDNTMNRMAVGESRGKTDLIECCFNVFGMSLRPVPLDAMNAMEAVHAAA